MRELETATPSEASAIVPRLAGFDPETVALTLAPVFPGAPWIPRRLVRNADDTRLPLATEVSGIACALVAFVPFATRAL